jgi:hypothetical protein
MRVKCSWKTVAVNSWCAATRADGLSLFQARVKARGLESDGQVSLAAEMFVLDVSKPWKTGDTSKHCISSSRSVFSSLQ